MQARILAFLLLLMGLSARAQTDTTGIYGERADSLDATYFVGRAQGNFLSKGRELRTEVISSAGLMKMACCNLAESFENSASVTVGYADATTGARQIRLLGLSGIYSQMLDENRPVMRGILAPYSLSFVPGSWLESIQVGKGSPSVINGVESMTGSINLEHAKPTDGKPLFVNASVMNDTKTDLNILSSLEVADELYTVLLGHVDGNFRTSDMNQDGFADEPGLFQVNVANRWLWHTPECLIHWGVRFVHDERHGGRMDGLWRSDVANRLANAYVKAGWPLRDDNSASVALVADYTLQRSASTFGLNLYNATQHGVFANLIYRNEFSESHDLTAGVNAFLDFFTEDIAAGGQALDGVRTRTVQFSPYAEYTFHREERLSVIAGVSGTVIPGRGFFPAPRLTVKYQPDQAIVLRANGGRGLRLANPVADNIGLLSTGKRLHGDLSERFLEDAWTFGGNATAYFGESNYFSVDYFQTRFTSALLLNRERPADISFYHLDGHSAFSHNLQADLYLEPFRGFSLTLTGRYTDARAWQPSGEVREVALNSRFKGILNAQYKTRANRWIFDFTASVTGTSRVYDFMLPLYPGGRTPAYPLLYAQITRRFRGFDIYIGGENLTNYMQMDPIIAPDAPFGDTFDAASVWGPLMGIKVYAGFRVTIWK